MCKLTLRNVPDCKKFCPLLWKPVCGSDSKTYGNECELTSKACLANADVAVAHAGECKTEEETTLEPETEVPEEDKNPCPMYVELVHTQVAEMAP
jgi:hypothetical protein